MTQAEFQQLQIKSRLERVRKEMEDLFEGTDLDDSASYQEYLAKKRLEREMRDETSMLNA